MTQNVWLFLIYKSELFRIDIESKILFLILISILKLEKKIEKKFCGLKRNFMSIFNI